jgi:hypothetical protein
MIPLTVANAITFAQNQTTPPPSVSMANAALYATPAGLIAMAIPAPDVKNKVLALDHLKSLALMVQLGRIRSHLSP